MLFLLDLTVDNQKDLLKDRRIDYAPNSVLVYKPFYFQTHLILQVFKEIN